MLTSARLLCGVSALVVMLSSGHLRGAAVAQVPPTPGSGQRFPLTVDSIMRGPRLVGYPPSQLRWAGDSYFEVAAFPVENHAFEEETSWADEYKRVLKLFDTHLKGTL